MRRFDKLLPGETISCSWLRLISASSFANARTKAQCVILACMEIDKTEPIEEDLATGKYVSWWKNDPMFKTKEDKQ